MTFCTILCSILIGALITTYILNHIKLKKNQTEITDFSSSETCPLFIENSCNYTADDLFFEFTKVEDLSNFHQFSKTFWIVESDAEIHYGDLKVKYDFAYELGDVIFDGTYIYVAMIGSSDVQV